MWVELKDMLVKFIDQGHRSKIKFTSILWSLQLHAFTAKS